MKPLFKLGQVVITAGAKEELTRAEVLENLAKHATGNWGDLTETDKALNDEAVVDECRILSKYTAASGYVFYIITEADRSATTILLREEY